MSNIPTITDVSITDMHENPTQIYARLRREAPVALLESTGRVLLTKAEDVRAAKDNSDIWTSEDTTTPAERAFQATSMMRKDGDAHQQERRALFPALSPRTTRDVWLPLIKASTENILNRLKPLEKFTKK